MRSSLTCDESSTAPLLVTLTGRDRPGVTSRLFSELARFPLVVVDTEQIVLRGRLILGVLVDLAGADAAAELALRDGLSHAARDLGLEIEITVGPERWRRNDTRPTACHGARPPTSARGHGRSRRLHCELRCEHRSHRAARERAGHLHRDGRLGCRSRRLACRTERASRIASGRRRSAAQWVVPSREETCRHGRRFDARARRGHRDAG